MESMVEGDGDCSGAPETNVNDGQNENKEGDSNECGTTIDLTSDNEKLEIEHTDVSSTKKPPRGGAKGASTPATSSGVKRAKAASSTPAVDNVPPYVVEDADILRKIEFNQEKIRKLAHDIITVESYPEYQDNCFDIETMISVFLSFPTRPYLSKQSSGSAKMESDISGGGGASATSDSMQIDGAASTSIDQLDPDMEFVKELHMCFRNIISSTVQGSSKSKDFLMNKLKERVSSIRSRLEAQQGCDNSSSSSSSGGGGGSGGDGDSDQDREKYYDMMFSYLTNLEDSMNLQNELTDLAQRQSYGAQMKGLSDEMVELCLINRWEVVSLTLLPPAFANIIKETRNVRSKYKRLIIAIKTLIEKLLKTPPSASEFKEKVDDLEGKVSKASIEVEKVKEKRREELAKADKKAKDESAKLQKQREKEEADALKLQKQKEQEEAKLLKQKEQEEAKAKKAQEAKEELEKKQKKLAEADAEKNKEKQIKEKQSSMFKSFFKAAPEKPSTTAAGSSAAPSRATSSSSPSKSADENSGKYQELDRLFRETMPMHEILRQFKTRHDKDSARWKITKSKKHKPKKINVTVDIDNSDRGGGSAAIFAAANSEKATFSEIREVEVDGFMRTLKFCEDMRPAYYGTFSKKSKVLNGRKPFHKDSDMFNYDVDSEAEWSEEEEGEDIAMSEGDDSEDDEDPDEVTDENGLVYDEFFLQDNDFGSDADSDGEQMTATIMQKKSQKWAGVSVAGPRFIRGFALPRAYKAVMSTSNATTSPSSVSFIPCDAKDDDVFKLSQFVAISHAYTNNIVMPFLGQEIGESTAEKDKEKDSKADKVEVEKGFDDNTIKSFIEFVHGKKDNVDKIVNDFYDIYNVNPNGAGASVSAAAATTATTTAVAMSSATSPSSDQMVVVKDDMENDNDMNSSSCNNNNNGGAGSVGSRVIPKTHIKRRLSEIAGKERHPDGYGSCRWIVKSEFIEKFEAKVDDILFTPKVKKQKTKKDPSSSKDPASDSKSSASGSAKKSSSSSASSSVPSSGNLFLQEGSSSSPKAPTDPNEIDAENDAASGNENEDEVVEAVAPKELFPQ